MKHLPFSLSAALLATPLLAACVATEPLAPGDEGARRLPGINLPYREAPRPGAREARPLAPDASVLLRPEDRAKIARLRETTAAALLDAIASGRSARGDLAASRAALTAVPLPFPTTGIAGAYRCRTIKHGGPVGVIAYRDFACSIRVEGDALILAKPEGSQRMLGRLMIAPSLGADGRTALLYAGSEYLSDESPVPYPGGRPEVGLFERTDETRYRLVIPEPGIEGLLDVIALERTKAN